MNCAKLWSPCTALNSHRMKARKSSMFIFPSFSALVSNCVALHSAHSNEEAKTKAGIYIHNSVHCARIFVFESRLRIKRSKYITYTILLGIWHWIWVVGRALRDQEIKIYNTHIYDIVNYVGDLTLNLSCRPSVEGSRDQNI